MRNTKLVVRWDDKEGKSHRQEYNNVPEARKARDWLVENGATNVDIAISSSRGEYAKKQQTEPSPMFPQKKQQELL